MPRIRGFNGGATGESAVPTERGPVSTWSWFSMPHTDCGAKYCNQFKGDVSWHGKTYWQTNPERSRLPLPAAVLAPRARSQ
jgi:hypothetical protein